MFRSAESGGVFRVADGCFIPNDPTLLSWQEYQDWLGAGNTVLPADAPVQAPVTSISLAQARAGLIMRGLFATIADHIEAIADPVQRDLAKNDFEYRNEVELGYPLVAAIQSALGWTDEQVAEFFSFCSAL